MSTDIDIALLRAFVAVAETGGMTSAGRLINLTQAAVSQQIKRLEELFQVTLFDRQSRSLLLTNDGERLLMQARRLIALNDEVAAAMISREFEGEVALGVPHDLVGAFVPPLLNSFRRKHPGIRVAVVSSTTQKLFGMMGAGRIALTMTTEPAPASGLDMLLQQPLVWVGARGGTAFKRRPLPTSFGDETCAHRKVALPALRSLSLDWVHMCEASEANTIIATVEADLAVGLMLACTVPPQIDILRSSTSGLPQLQDFFINLRLPPAGVSDMARALADHIREHFAVRLRHAV